MKNVKLFVLAAVLGWGMVASAAYLSWQVGEIGSGSGIKSGYNAARVIARDAEGNETALALIDPSPDGTAVDTVAGNVALANSGNLVAELEGDSSSWANYSFFIEIVNWDFANHRWGEDEKNAVYGTSDTKTYNQINSYVFDDVSELDPTSYWQGTGYAVPEPTSGLLVMIGLGLAGLRRRRNAVA